eukprot:2931361-Prymnesium_polylepis.2
MLNAFHASRNGTIMFADDCTRFWGAVLFAFQAMQAKGMLVASPHIPSKKYYSAHHGWCGALVNHPVAPSPLR